MKLPYVETGHAPSLRIIEEKYDFFGYYRRSVTLPFNSVSSPSLQVPLKYQS